MPFDAPVTTATCPSSFFDMTGLLLFFLNETTTASGRARTRKLSRPAFLARSHARPRRATKAKSPARQYPVAVYCAACFDGARIQTEYSYKYNLADIRH